MARKYIVTGSHGFIGSHLVSKLGEGNCWCIDWKIGKDAARPSDYPKEDGQFDAIFHLAGHIHDGYPPNEILANNTSSTMRVLEEAKRLKAKVIFVSSAGVYADLPGPQREDGNLDYSASSYATSKRIGEELCQLYWRRCGVPAVVLRLFNAYGPRGNSVINTWHGLILKREKVLVNGNGEHERDYVHVKDAVDALVSARNYLEKSPSYDVFNVGTGVGTELLGLMSMMMRIYGITVPHGFSGKPGGVRYSRASTQRCLERMGFRTSIGLEEGLKMLE